MGLIEDHDAQFMLLAGFLIALGLVITTVMLNSIIFEGNMAIESVTENSKYEMVNLMQITTDEIRSAYRNATERGGNTTINFTRQVNNFSADLPKIYSMYGEGAKITYENWTNKGRANFTENGRPGGNNNWTVVEGVKVNNVSVFNFTIYLNDLTGSIFKIEARDSTGYPVWSVEFNSTKSNVSNATYPANYTIVEFTPGNQVNLSESKYQFINSTSSYPSVSIHIIYGRNAFGTYKILGLANNRNFTRERDYVLNTTVALSTAKVKANISMPVTVPW